VKVTGKFLGGKIQAKDKIHINGEFTGSLESNEVELGASARGKGEILYKETLCIQQGAKMEGKVTRAGAERMPVP
jgi:cytoskeletal protein CcmA (bactofilin family)